MSKYIGCWFGLEEAEEENGAVRIAHSFEAVNDKQAKAKAALLFMEAFPDGDDTQFDFRIYAETGDVPCPSEDWDETFLFDHEWDDELGHPVAPVVKTKAKTVDFENLQQSLRVAVLVKYHTAEITSDQLGGAIELQQDDSSTFDSHTYAAITKMPAVAEMYPERVLEAIDFIRKNCAPTKKWPEIKAALSGWLKSHEAERKDGNIEAIETGSTESANIVVPRPYNHTHNTLDVEIATALWAGDVDPNAPQPSVTRWANGIIKEDREDFKRWSILLRTQENILKFDRPTIFGVVRNVPAADTYRFPESHKRYITEYLKAQGKMENSNDETVQNTTASTGPLEYEPAETNAVAPQHTDDVSTAGTLETTPPLEGNGPFYFLMADGEKVGRANKRAGLEKAMADGGTEISHKEYQARKNGTYVDPVEEQQARKALGAAFDEHSEKLEAALGKDTSAQTEVKKIADGVFSIDNLMGEQAKTTTVSDAAGSSNEVDKPETVTSQQTPSSFQSIGAALENDLAEKGDNMKIWRSVMRTDPRYTKDLAGVGFEGTSINAEYMIMRATEIFGPIGTGWGFEVMEDRMLPGAPMSETIYEDKKIVGNRLLRDGDGTLITEKNHSIKIKFWYAIEGDIRGEVEAYGATKYLYKTKHGITCDGEAQKKSLTDAIKKALSLLGFSADVWLGLYDQAEYKQENAIEFDIRNASDKAEDVTRIRKELDEKFKLNTDSMRSAVTPNEISGMASSLTRVMGVHLKAARDKADHEYTKYLEGRLRRLEEVKAECLNKLQEKAA